MSTLLTALYRVRQGRKEQMLISEMNLAGSPKTSSAKINIRGIRGVSKK